MALCIANNGKERIIIKDKKTGKIIITIFPYRKLENHVKIRFEATERYNIYREKAEGVI